MQYNSDTGLYEGSVGGQRVAVDPAHYDEGNAELARAMYGRSYDDLTAAEQARVDSENSDPFYWKGTDYDEAGQ